jgi:hypothetical protein
MGILLVFIAALAEMPGAANRLYLIARHGAGRCKKFPALGEIRLHALSDNL